MVPSSHATGPGIRGLGLDLVWKKNGRSGAVAYIVICHAGIQEKMKFLQQCPLRIELAAIFGEKVSLGPAMR
jgi:hypothetical protein